MPITERQKEAIVAAIGQLNANELIAISEIMYQTILDAKLTTDQLTTIGKLIYAKVGWREYQPVLTKMMGGDEEKGARLANALRFPFVKATEEFLLPNLVKSFEVVPDQETAAAAPAVAQPPAPTPAVDTAGPEGEIGGPEDQTDDPDLSAMLETASGENGHKAPRAAKPVAPAVVVEERRVEEPVPSGEIKAEATAEPAAEDDDDDDDDSGAGDPDVEAEMRGTPDDDDGVEEQGEASADAPADDDEERGANEAQPS